MRVTLSEEEKEAVRDAINNFKDSTGFEAAAEKAVETISVGLNKAVEFIRRRIVKR